MPAWRPWSRTRTGRPDPSERRRRYWDKHARSYDRQMAFLERVLFGAGRRWVCSQAAGDVLEVAIGSGRNLPLYPQGIRLTGIDFSPEMLQLARREAARLGRQVDLRLGDAQAMVDLPDASFDTVVCTLSLCAIPDQRRAITEMRRVLRPGGRLLLLDHGAAGPRLGRAIQWLLERVTIPLGGEHLRRPLLQVQGEGFDVERRERHKLGFVERLAARKPSDPDASAIEDGGR